MSLHYLVKLSVRVLQVNSRQYCEPKTTPKCFCHIVYKTWPILIKFCACCPEYICHKVICFSPHLNSASTLPCKT